MNNPNISICIPAYKNKVFLERLLDSIKIQSYKNFEVVITDDSPDDELVILIEKYKSYFDINYIRNTENLNTPENWNEAIRKSKFEWIKIIHDDDWFVDSESLRCYAEEIISNPSIDFFFSAYQNIYIECNKNQEMFLSPLWRYLLKSTPEILFSRNVVGPPSVTLYRRSRLEFDKSMKYIVDIDFYTNYIFNKNWSYIPKLLINVGIHASQVTKYTFGISDFHFKESLLMLLKKNEEYFEHPVVFDGWWRLIRNFEITSTEAFSQYPLKSMHLKNLNTMIGFQRLIGRRLIRIGVISKILMSLAYIKSRIY